MRVPGTLEGVRVDRAVAMVTGMSRAAAAELVAAGRVRVDGVAVASRSAPLVEGSDLSFDVPAPADPLPTADPAIEVVVVHEDEELVVVDKPAGLVVHPGAGHEHDTLVSGLLARFPELAEVGDPMRPGIVHRLDRGTSGLLVVARTAAAHRSLAAQLAAHTAGRRYLALVSGHVEEDRGEVDAPIGRSARTPTRMAVAEHGRPARTTYWVLGRYDLPVACTFLAVSLATGRTHQIRVHLSAIGHPVVGDDRYGGGAVPGLDRLFLHAAALSLDHPRTGERCTWSSPLPEELTTLVGGGARLPPLPPGDPLPAANPPG
ncbi:MAG: RluA family pseudouridine synthase [Acidimicrobiales bacterium]